MGAGMDEFRLTLASDTLATLLQKELAQLSEGCVYTDMYQPNIVVLSGADIAEDCARAEQILQNWIASKFRYD